MGERALSAPQKVFLLNTRRITRPVQEMWLPILVGKKKTWAVREKIVIPFRPFLKRKLYMYGVTAFPTLQSAERMKYMRIRDLASRTNMLERMGLYQYAGDIRAAWNEYKKTGVVH